MLKRDDEEHPIPPRFRGTFGKIVDAFCRGDFALSDPPVDGVAAIDATTQATIASSIAGYGDPLASLDEATWDRSCYRWMESHWEMLVDLTTTREAVSDLTLHARFHDGPQGLIEVTSVHVP